MLMDVETTQLRVGRPHLGLHGKDLQEFLLGRPEAPRLKKAQSKVEAGVAIAWIDSQGRTKASLGLMKRSSLEQDNAEIVMGLGQLIVEEKGATKGLHGAIGLAPMVINQAQTVKRLGVARIVFKRQSQAGLRAVKIAAINQAHRLSDLQHCPRIELHSRHTPHTHTQHPSEDEEDQGRPWSLS